MRKILLTVIGLSVVLPLAQSRGEEAADVQMIVDKAIKAAGGLEVLEKFQKQKGKEAGTYHGGGEAMPFTATFASQAPEKFRMEVSGAFTIVLNGDKGWVNAGGTTTPMNDEQLKEQQEEQLIAAILTLVPLVKQKDQLKMSAIEGKTVDERATVGLKVEREGHRDVELYFDKESYDLVKAEYMMKSAELGNQEVKQEVIFRGFKDVDGARLAMDVLILRDGKKYVEAKMSDIEAVEEFPAETFAEP
jgi:outer membrane lipoprotein-sorting protein